MTADDRVTGTLFLGTRTMADEDAQRWSGPKAESLPPPAEGRGC